MNKNGEQTELLRQIRNSVRIIMWLLLAPIVISLVIFALNIGASFESS